MNRIETVRAAYQRFNEGDFEGVLELCDPEIEFRDLLSDATTAHGRDALRQRWATRFGEATVHASVGDVLEMGNTVIAAVCYQAYHRDGTSVGPYAVVTDEFTFRGDRLLRVKATKFDEVSAEVTALLSPPTPSASST